MARPSGPKTRCGGQWTEAKFHSFIKNNLRHASRKWAPISKCLSDARVKRGFYKCAECEEIVPASTKDPETGKRIKNIVVDHINPIIDPHTGFTTWDDVINRMFCEDDNLQALCYSCHKQKTDKEKAITAERRRSTK